MNRVNRSLWSRALRASAAPSHMARRAAAGITALGIGMATLAGDGPPCPYTVTVAGTAPNCGFWGCSNRHPTAISSLDQWA